MNQVIENKYTKFAALGLFLTSIIVIAGPVSEPVNVPKMLFLVTLAFGIATYLFSSKNFYTKSNKHVIFLPSIVFLVLAFLASILSSSPFSQNFYGIYGRNTGLLTYISFIIIFIFCSLLKEKSNIEKIIFSFIATFCANILYAAITVFFGDPIPWSNNYGALLGLLGNPDFAGALFGMASGVSLSYLLTMRLNKIKIIIFSALTLLSLWCVILTKTTQGILVALISITTVVLMYTFYKFSNKIYFYTILTITTFSGIIALLGMLQIGPATSFLYKRSVSLRGVYWDAAFQAGISHPFTGVGFDAFGDWYRRTRSLKAATWFPGPETITNVAHNYYLDIFAYGGALLLLSYLCFTLIGLVSAIRILRKSKGFDEIAAILIASFVAFQAQALISIPQIGLALWGWVLSGLLYSYSRIEISANFKNNSINNKRSNATFPSGVMLFVGMSIGFTLAVPPFSADVKWTSAVNSQDLKKVEAALRPSYFSPENSDRLANAAILLQNNKFPDLANKYALQAAEFNPDNFSAWKIIYFFPNSSVEDRNRAFMNMKRLDPLNKNLGKLG